MTLVAEHSAPPGSSDEIQVLFREARQRRRRRQRRIAIFVVVVVLAAAITAIGFATRRTPAPTSATKSTNSRSPHAAHPDTGATLVYSLNGLRFINADSGQTSSLPLPAPLGGASDRSMLRVGGSFILNRGDTAWLYRSGDVAAPIDLGPSLRVIPGPSQGEVWLWGNRPFGSAANGYVRLLNLSGQQVGPTVDLPNPWIPSGAWVPSGGAVDGGIVIYQSIRPGPSSAIPNLEVWNPFSDQVIRSFVNAAAVAANGMTLAWRDTSNCAPHCVLHLTDLRTGAQHNVAMPRGATPDTGSFSPDGRMLALSLWFDLRQPPGLHRTAVAIVNVPTGTVRLLPGSEQNLMNPDPGTSGMFAPTWSQTGWAFFTAYASGHILTWHEGRPKAIVLPHARLPHLEPFATVPSMIAL